MKKLAITSVAVLIALIGFTAILVCLPCGDGCCVREAHEGCEMHDANCSGEKKACGHEGKCADEKSGCESGKGHHEGGPGGCDKGEGSHSGAHDGCGGGNEKCTVREWKDAEGKCHKEVQIVVGDGKGMSCPMDNADHSACCGCCPMKSGGGDACCGDSAKTDSVRYKVRGKL